MWAKSFNGDERSKLLSEFHLNSYALGFAFHNDNRKPLYISAGLTAGGPLNQFEENTESLVTSCGCYFVELDSWAVYDLKSLVYIFYNTRLRYRTSGLSSLWFHKAGGYFQTKRFNFGLSANFFFPLFLDSYQQEPKKRTLVLQRVNAGSHKFYSINPMALSFTGWMELKAGLASFALYGNIDTFGKNYARGFTLGLLARFVFSMESDPSNYKNYKHLNELPEEGEEPEEYFSEEGGEDTKDSEYFSEEEDPEAENLFPEEEDSAGEDLFPEEENDETQNKEENSDLLSDDETEEKLQKKSISLTK